MWAHYRKSKGFTIVELLITIVIVGMLATLVAVNYNSAQTKTKATDEMTDIKTLNRALQAYFAENSAYPTSGGTWLGWTQAQDFIPGLTPKYIAKQPQQKDTANGYDNSYIYYSDGTNYKLISHKSASTLAICTTAAGINPAMTDPNRNCWAFGVWTDGAKWW